MCHILYEGGILLSQTWCWNIVNVINILSVNLLYKSKLSSLSLIMFGFAIFCHQNIDKKVERNMLMKWNRLLKYDPIWFANLIFSVRNHILQLSWLYITFKTFFRTFFDDLLTGVCALCVCVCVYVCVCYFSICKKPFKWRMWSFVFEVLFCSRKSGLKLTVLKVIVTSRFIIRLNQNS